MRKFATKILTTEDTESTEALVRNPLILQQSLCDLRVLRGEIPNQPVLNSLDQGMIHSLPFKTSGIFSWNFSKRGMETLRT
jgi:hypothetical protein